MQTNAKGQRLQCSHFLGRETQPKQAPPIVVYCHCNSGSRRDAEEAVYALLPSGITVFAFDFAVRQAITAIRQHLRLHKHQQTCSRALTAFSVQSGTGQGLLWV